MHNRVTLTGRLVDAPKVRTYEQRGDTFEVVSLWLEVKAEHRTDRFTVEIHCPKAGAAAAAMKADVIADVTGALRHDRWKDKASGKWTSKVFVVIEPGEGNIHSKGLAAEADRAEAA